MMFQFECILKRFILLCMIALMPLNMGFLDPMRSDVKKANEQYKNKDYDTALKSYMDIQVERPGEALLDYDIGNTLYQQKRYDDAIEHYEKVILNGNSMLQTKAQYNTGNSMYQKGLQSESSGKLQEAIKMMKSGLEYYKQALHNNPNDKDIKYNIEFVQNEIKRILDKAKQQQKQQGKQQQQGEQKQNQQQNQAGQQQKGKQQQGQQKQQQQGNQQKQGEKKQQQKQGNQEKENEGQQQAIAQQDNEGTQQNKQKQGKQQKKKGTELTKQEAEKLLKNIPDKQKKQQRQRSNRGYLGGVERNW